MSLRLELDEELERKFREMAMKEFGYRKGSITKATEVAITNWVKIKESKKPIKKVSDPLKLIEGCMSKYKGRMTSVELQHEATRLWAKK